LIQGRALQRALHGAKIVARRRAAIANPQD